MWIRRLAYLLTHARRDAELREEIEVHRSMRQSDLERRGSTASDAAKASHRAMGNVVLAREDAHDVWRWPRLDGLFRDVRSAIRGLRSARAYTWGSLVSLSLAFAALAIAMAILNAYLFRPLPYPAADRLSRVTYSAPGQPEPQQIRLDWSELGDVVEQPLPTGIDLFYLTEGQYTTAVSGLRVAPDALPLLGARAARGRLLAPSDLGDRVAVITDLLWRTRFGADPDIVGRTFRAYSANAAAPTETIRIIGVLTPDFWLMREGTEIVVPLDPRARAYLVRLKEGVPPQQAARRITEAIRATTAALPQDWAGVRVERLQESYVVGVRPILNAMAVVVGLGIVLVCLNVAMLTVLRIVRRQKEVAVRLALGARRSHVIRMIGTEAIVLCMVASLTGLIAAHYGLPLLANPLQQQLGVAVPGGASSLIIDARTILAVSAIAVVAAVVLCAMAIALIRWHTLPLSLGPGPRTDSVPRWFGMRATLLSLEIAGAVALLVGSGVMIRTISNLVATDLGFETTDVVRAHLALPAQRYQDPAALAAFYDELTRQLNGRARAMAITNFTSFYEPQKHPLEIEGRSTDVRTGVIAVSDDYFTVLGMHVAAGRSFSTGDRLGTEPVVIVSEALAARLWPGQNAVGQRIRTAEELTAGAPLRAWRTVVGVVSDVKQTYEDVDSLDVYLPFFQTPNRFASLFIRTDQSGSQWLDALRDIIGAVDPEVTIDSSRALASEAAARLAVRRFLRSLLLALSIVTTALAMIGVYAVIAYAIEQRRREVAIRLALGATVRSINGMFFNQASRVLVAGGCMGVLGAFGVTNVLHAQIYGVDGFDWPVLLASCLLIAVVTYTAAAVPTCGVARMSASSVLKSE